MMVAGVYGEKRSPRSAGRQGRASEGGVKPFEYGPPRKAQSAMEYLMTYGWAILIIAVVLIALFSLGVFDPFAFSPRAQPGSCQAIRPLGAGISTDINLAGTCNDEIPKFVAVFNGKDTMVNVPETVLTGSDGFTLSFWFYYQSTTYSCSTTGIVEFANTIRNSIVGLLGCAPPSSFGYACSGKCYNNGLLFSSTQPVIDRWESVIYTYDSTTGGMNIFVDGSSIANSLADGFPGATEGIVIPAGSHMTLAPKWELQYNGMLSNVQLYNTSFGQAEVDALYKGGIGGIPIALQNLVGWWPLNGDVQDYSGNQNPGSPSNMIFTDSWTTGYSPP